MVIISQNSRLECPDSLEYHKNKQQQQKQIFICQITKRTVSISMGVDDASISAAESLDSNM